MQNAIRVCRKFLQPCFAVVLAFPALAQVDVLNHHSDAGRTGANLQETHLNPSNVRNGTFGKLVYRILDGNPYAQPLIVTGVKIDGRGATDVAIVATEHNSVYAFDANDINPSSTSAQLWHTGPNVLGNHVDSQQLYNDIGIPTCADLTTEVGITGTPAIQLTRPQAPREGVIFVAAKSKSNGAYAYTLFALNLSNGVKLSQTLIQGQAAGSGIGSIVVNGRNIIRFNAEYQLNRPALLISGNTLYIAFGGHCDTGPYHGWVFAYDISNPAAPKQVSVLCDTPNGIGKNEGRAGIWMSGEGPALDENGFVYLATGDGTYDGITDFGDSAIKLKLAGRTLQILDWFTPQNQVFLKNNDVDLGSGGIVLLPNSHLLLVGGKEGRMYLIDRDHMGKGTAASLSSIQVTHVHDGINFYNIHGSPAIWPGAAQIFIYINGEENPFNQYRLVPDSTPGGPGWKFDPPHGPYRTTANCAKKPNCLTSPYPNYPTGLFGQANRSPVWMPGGFMTLSAKGDDRSSGVLWVAMPLADNANKQVVRGVLRALDASDISKPELWDSESTGHPNDRLGQFAKFCPPTVANGKVYVVTFQQEIILENGIHQVAPPPADQPALAIYGLEAFHHQ